MIKDRPQMACDPLHPRDHAIIVYSGFFTQGKESFATDVEVRRCSTPLPCISLMQLQIDYQLHSDTFIVGWDEALEGACEGETRTVIIPPVLTLPSTHSKTQVPQGKSLTFTIFIKKIYNRGHWELSDSTFNYHTAAIGVVSMILIGLLLSWSLSSKFDARERIPPKEKKEN